MSTFVLNSGYFPKLDPRSVPPPLLIGRFGLDDERNLFYFAFVALVGAIFVTVNLRRSRAGRAILAVRDNESAAAAHAIDPTRTKLFAFAFSGALAGFAGGLFVVANRGIGSSGTTRSCRSKPSRRSSSAVSARYPVRSSAGRTSNSCKTNSGQPGSSSRPALDCSSS